MGRNRHARRRHRRARRRLPGRFGRVLREGTGRSDDRDRPDERLQPAGHRISGSAEGRTFWAAGDPLTSGSSVAASARQHVRIGELERKVLLEFFLDLVQKHGRDRSGDREDSDRDLGIAHHLLDNASEGDDARLVVEARPQIDITVRVALYLAAAVEQPRVFGVLAPEQDGQQEIAIVAAEQRKVAGRRADPRSLQKIRRDASRNSWFGPHSQDHSDFSENCCTRAFPCPRYGAYSDKLQKLKTTLRLVSSRPFLDNGATQRIRLSGLLLRSV